MTADEFKDHCAPYWYRGTMTLSPMPWTYEDNPHYFTAWYFKILNLLGGFDQERLDAYRDHLVACDTGHLVPHRDPVSREAEKISHDELVGASCLSNPFARRLRLWAKSNWWSLDNRTPHWTIRGFLPLRLYPPAFLYEACGFKPPLWASLLYALDCLATTLKPTGKTSGRMQLLLISDVTSNSRSMICRWATMVFRKSLHRRYGTWDNLLAIYFPEPWPFKSAVAGWKFI